MTCVVGFADKKTGKVYMGGDSQATNFTNLTKRNRLDGKVFIKKGRDGIEMLFGFTQSYRMGQLLKHKLVIPKQQFGNDFDYMCSDFMDEVIDCMEVNKFAKIDCNEVTGGEFLVGYKGNLYCCPRGANAPIHDARSGRAITEQAGKPEAIFR